MRDSLAAEGTEVLYGTYSARSFDDEERAVFFGCVAAVDEAGLRAGSPLDGPPVRRSERRDETTVMTR